MINFNQIHAWFSEIRENIKQTKKKVAFRFVQKPSPDAILFSNYKTEFI